MWWILQVSKNNFLYWNAHQVDWKLIFSQKVSQFLENFFWKMILPSLIITFLLSSSACSKLKSIDIFRSQILQQTTRCLSVKHLFQVYTYAYIRYLFWWTSSLIELFTDNFCGNKGLKSINFWPLVPKEWWHSTKKYV